MHCILHYKSKRNHVLQSARLLFTESCSSCLIYDVMDIFLSDYECDNFVSEVPSNNTIIRHLSSMEEYEVSFKTNSKGGKLLRVWNYKGIPR